MAPVNWKVDVIPATIPTTNYTNCTNISYSSHTSSDTSDTNLSSNKECDSNGAFYRFACLYCAESYNNLANYYSPDNTN
jgi:hypothetical protein